MHQNSYKTSALLSRLTHFIVLFLLTPGMSRGAPTPAPPDTGRTATVQAVCVPGPEGRHPTWNGRTTILKGVVQGDPGHEFTYAWDAGDGSPKDVGTVTDPYAVAATHVYTGAVVPGQSIQATLTVTDVTAGQAASCTYPVSIHGDEQQVRIDAAIDDGLWFLHTTVQRHTENGVNLGLWNANSPVATAGTAVLAFEVQGHQADGDPDVDPYVETMQRGLNYLLDQMQSRAIGPQSAGDPDTNGNDLGLYASSLDRTVMYEVGIVTMALAGSGTADAIAHSPNPDVDGRTYQEVAQDLVDFMAWAQADANCGSARGGWRYEADVCDADMSVSQWPVLGMQAAENNWRVQVPAWVKSELRGHFLTYAQGSDGGFGYQGPDGGNIARTAAGLVGLAFTGASSASRPVQQAADFVERDWASDNVGNFYAMYGVMKASKLTKPEISRYGAHDWYTEYATYLTAQQRPDGSWEDPGYGSGNVPLSTGWAILILSPTVFAAPLVLPHLPPWIWLLFLIPLFLLGGLIFWQQHKARQKHPDRKGPPERRPDDNCEGTPKEKGPKPGGKDITHGEYMPKEKDRSRLDGKDVTRGKPSRRK